MADPEWKVTARKCHACGSEHGSTGAEWNCMVDTITLLRGAIESERKASQEKLERLEGELRRLRGELAGARNVADSYLRQIR